VVTQLAVRPASAAAPVWNTGGDTGVCSSGHALGLQQLGWCNALRGEVLLLREHDRHFGLGPALRLGTASFDDLRMNAGLSVLLPLFESFPLVLEAGPHLRNFRQPGVYSSAFFGVRSFNYYGHYEMAAGLAVTAERSFSDGTPSALWLTARLDGSWLVLPFIFLVNGLK
jgi:hypothetical protein